MGHSWGWWTLQAGTPIILVVGLIGNILSLIVLKSRRYRHKSYSHYLSCLAVFDSLVLVNKYLVRVYELVDLQSTFGSAACRLDNFVGHVCYLMSGWIVVCITVERYLHVV